MITQTIVPTPNKDTPMFTKRLLPPKRLLITLLIIAIATTALAGFHMTATPFNAAGHTRTARCLYYWRTQLLCTIDWTPVTRFTSSPASP